MLSDIKVMFHKFFPQYSLGSSLCPKQKLDFNVIDMCLQIKQIKVQSSS